MQKNDSRCRGMIAGVEEEQVQKRRNSRCRGEEAGAKKELVLGVLCGGNWFASSWYHTDWSMISAPSCLLSAVRLVAPHSLQVLHIDTQRCNISWKVSQVSHYIEPYLEFEARRRLLGHSWEVRNGQASASTPSCSGVYPFSVSTCWCDTDSAWSSDMPSQCLLGSCFYCLGSHLAPYLCSPSS